MVTRVRKLYGFEQIDNSCTKHDSGDTFHRLCYMEKVQCCTVRYRKLCSAFFGCYIVNAVPDSSWHGCRLRRRWLHIMYFQNLLSIVEYLGKLHFWHSKFFMSSRFSCHIPFHRSLLLSHIPSTIFNHVHKSRLLPFYPFLQWYRIWVYTLQRVTCQM